MQLLRMLCPAFILMNDFSKCWFFSIQKEAFFCYRNNLVTCSSSIDYLIFTTMCRILISSKVGNMLQQQKRTDYPAYKTIAECSIKYVPLFLMTRHGLLNECYTPSRTNVVY